jgi:hypothetical protein
MQIEVWELWVLVANDLYTDDTFVVRYALDPFRILVARLSADYSQTQHTSFDSRKGLKQEGDFLTVTCYQIAACLCVDWCIEVLPPLSRVFFFLRTSY